MTRWNAGWLLLLAAWCAGAPFARAQHPAAAAAQRAVAAESSRARIFLARKVVTMEPGQPEANAVAVADGRIVAVGSLEAVHEALGPRPHQVDHRFRRLVLLPGFIDNHLHPTLAAVLLPGEFATPYDWELPGRRVQGVRGREAYLARLRELEAARAAPEEWLVVWGYHPLFHGELSRADLDAVSATRPILVWHRSFHEIFLNAAALAAWQVSEESVAGHPGVDFAAGRFYETGLLAVQAQLGALVLAPERFRRGLGLARELLHRGGLTTIADQGIPIFDLEAELAHLSAVFGSEGTPFRTLLIPNGMILGQKLGPERALALMRQLPARNTPRIRFLEQVKLFADGAFYSQLMQMRDGYLDGHQGEWLMTPEQLEAAARFYANAGWPVHVHVNGDLGVDVVLGILERLRAEASGPAPRFVLHHFGASTPEQAQRIAKLGAAVSANPFYVWALGDAYSQVGLGPERAAGMVRLGSLARHGVRTSLHSDLTMAPARPLTLAWVAANRITASGRVLGPDERITVEQALRGVTLDAAHALGLEGEIGSIAPGKRADFTVLEQDPLAVAPEKLKDVRIWGTVFEGTPHPLAAAGESAGGAGSDAQAAPEPAASAWRRKIHFDLEAIGDDGLTGPAGDRRDVGYEFCVGDVPARLAQVTEIDPSVFCQEGSSGRVGCTEAEVLCTGSTHQEGFRDVLRGLAELPWVREIREAAYE